MSLWVFYLYFAQFSHFYSIWDLNSLGFLTICPLKVNLFLIGTLPSSVSIPNHRSPRLIRLWYHWWVYRKRRFIGETNNTNEIWVQPDMDWHHFQPKTLKTINLLVFLLIRCSTYLSNVKLRISNTSKTKR